MIIDAHTHVFDRIFGRIGAGVVSSGKYGFALVGDEQVQIFPPFCQDTKFTGDNLIHSMETAGVSGAVLLQGCFYGDQNAYSKQTAINSDGRIRAAMYVEPWNMNSIDYFEENRSHFCAVKLECSVQTGFCGLRDFNLEEYIPFFRRVEASGMALVLDLGAAGERSFQTKAVERIMEFCPDLKIVICHLGQPRYEYLKSDVLMNEWKRQILLARNGQVWFDTASLNAFFKDDIYPHKTGSLFFNMALDMIGPSRIMFGSDLPGNTLIDTYVQIIGQIKIFSEEAGLNSQEIECIMSGNARTVFFRVQ